MGATPKSVPKDRFEEALKAAERMNAQFRVERTIATIVAVISFAVLLYCAMTSAISHNWKDSEAILLGSGGTCSSGFGALFYMYNRSLRFMETIMKG
ncbi:MAG: hypothetical protein JOY77_13170 [Alphaproteobacteria bacterium]|nr:hypothetical protein [Alphaproteobacteria bacterium]